MASIDSILKEGIVMAHIYNELNRLPSSLRVNSLPPDPHLNPRSQPGATATDEGDD